MSGTLLAIADQSKADTANPRTAKASLIDSNLSSPQGMRTSRESVRDSVTRTASVSLADLSTLEGSRAARERLEAMARHLCTKLIRSRELAYQPELVYQPNFAACVHETLAGAVARMNAVRAARESRIAQRTAP
jgi:hypothetical protein